MRAVVQTKVGGGLLRVVSLQRFDDIDLAVVRDGDRRLLLAVDGSLLLDDPLSSYIFERALAARGWLVALDPEAPTAVSDLVPAADWASEQLNAGAEVVVSCLGVPPALVAASVLVAAGFTPPEATAVVHESIPGAFDAVDLEVSVSVVKDQTILWRDLCRRRRELVQRGRSPWEAP